MSKHRRMFSAVLGRELPPEAVVHHIDGNHKNNDPRNLMLFATQGDHLRFHRGKGEEGISLIAAALLMSEDTAKGRTRTMGSFINYGGVPGF